MFVRLFDEWVVDEADQSSDSRPGLRCCDWFEVSMICASDVAMGHFLATEGVM